MIKVKESNDVLEEIILSSLKELSKLYSKQTGEKVVFDLYHNVRAYDRDMNLCFKQVLDVRSVDDNGKVTSYKNLYDRMVVQRPNTGTPANPKYGKQLNMEEARKTTLREVLSKAIAGFALGMAARTKDQIEDFNLHLLKNDYPVLEEDAFKIEDQDKYPVDKQELDTE